MLDPWLVGVEYGWSQVNAIHQNQVRLEQVNGFFGSSVRLNDRLDTSFREEKEIDGLSQLHLDCTRTNDVALQEAMRQSLARVESIEGLVNREEVLFKAKRTQLARKRLLHQEDDSVTALHQSSTGALTGVHMAYSTDGHYQNSVPLHGSVKSVAQCLMNSLI